MVPPPTESSGWTTLLAWALFFGSLALITWALIFHGGDDELPPPRGPEDEPGWLRWWEDRH